MIQLFTTLRAYTPDTSVLPVCSLNRIASTPQSTGDWWNVEGAHSNAFDGTGVRIEDVYHQSEGMNWVIKTAFAKDVLCPCKIKCAVDTIEHPKYSTGTTWYDVNHDDLFVCITVVYRDNQVEAIFESLESNIPYPGEESTLWTPQSDNNFEPVPDVEQNTVLPFQLHAKWDLLVNDFDHVNGENQLFSLHDGHCTSDLIRVPLNGLGEMYADQCPTGHHWLNIRLDKGNNDIDATIIVRTENTQPVRWMTAGGASFVDSSPQMAHFGLGSDNRLTSVDVEILRRDTMRLIYSIDINQQITLRP